MIPVHIAGLAIDVEQQPVVILKPIGEGAGEGRMLPIWIGGLEAAAIVAALGDTPPPRPLTLDLMRRVLDAVDAEVERVAVTRLENGTFYAEITLRTSNRLQVLDARPSDAPAPCPTDSSGRSGSGIRCARPWARSPARRPRCRRRRRSMTRSAISRRPTG